MLNVLKTIFCKETLVNGYNEQQTVYDVLE